MARNIPMPGRPDIDRLRQDHPLWHIDSTWVTRASGPDVRLLTGSRAGVRLAGFSAAELDRMITGAEDRYGWPRE